MSKEMCTKWRKAQELLQGGDMDTESFPRYTLSEQTMMRLESIRETMKDNIAQANPTWKIIAGEDDEKISLESEDSDIDGNEPNNSDSRMICDESILPSTQFYFTQVERTIEPVISVAMLPQKCDLLESLCENLERNNGRIDFVQLESLSNEDLISLIDELAEKLSSKGIYNLCQSMNEMTTEQAMKHLNVLCTHLLRPKMIELEEPSRLLSSAIGECAKRFPDEIQKFIFIPILNAELKDTTVIVNIVNAYDNQRKAMLLEEFLAFVSELKLWHIPVLQSFLSVRFDCDTINKVIKLFSGKALCYCKDKNFGKLVWSFLKVNMVLSKEQKSSMSDIAAVNGTIFKKTIENILKNI